MHVVGTNRGTDRRDTFNRGDAFNHGDTFNRNTTSTGVVTSTGTGGSSSSSSTVVTSSSGGSAQPLPKGTKNKHSHLRLLDTLQAPFPLHGRTQNFLFCLRFHITRWEGKKKKERLSSYRQRNRPEETCLKLETMEYIRY